MMAAPMRAWLSLGCGLCEAKGRALDGTRQELRYTQRRAIYYSKPSALPLVQDVFWLLPVQCAAVHLCYCNYHIVDLIVR